MRPPTESEIQQAAIQLGHIEPGEPVPARIRAKVAKALQLAVQMDSADDARDALSAGFVSTVSTTYADLTKAGLSDDAAARVVAAIAPHVWRANQGAAHAQGPR
ncbi:hypothetical protein [Rhodococcus pyridinivorans]|uniref:hypothetical protein n=1 Tax=Rhodococcus pyridinivorans TaxID=103816 RepID=UPI000BA29E81|nr:hypothetical protein [Rhodococcus pyridinivorans]